MTLHTGQRGRALAIIVVLAAGILSDPALPARSQQQTAQPPSTIDWEKFTHKSHSGSVKIPGTNAARELNCDACHDHRAGVTRLVGTTDRNRRLGVSFPGHKACVECHIPQFTGKPLRTCTICHQPEKLAATRPPERDFPARYDFNALFDARQHELHAGYNLPGKAVKTDCTFCHQADQRPAPLGIASHPECFACHSPSSQDPKARLKAGCQVCHTTMTDKVVPFAAKLISRAYGALFTHRSHVGYVNGRCDACHTIAAGYNQPVPRTVRVKAHLTPGEKSGRGCFSCHDDGEHYGRKVFSGDGSCNKCHDRQDFKVTPR